jgi:hypothetical protein
LDLVKENTYKGIQGYQSIIEFDRRPGILPLAGCERRVGGQDASCGSLVGENTNKGINTNKDVN